MEHVSLKLESTMAKKMDSLMREFHYATKTEFIREAIREKIRRVEEEQRMKKAQVALTKYRGMLKDTTPFKTADAFLEWRRGKGGAEAFRKLEEEVKRREKGK
jgi:Arc/MetJ-type ribon-helix-helix transcriptional regulator